jgi:hypothetical protein
MQGPAAVGSGIWFPLPEPRRGGLIIAPGKAVEAAARGKSHPTQPFFPSGLARERAKPEGKKEKIILGPLPLRLPWAELNGWLPSAAWY